MVHSRELITTVIIKKGAHASKQASKFPSQDKTSDQTRKGKARQAKRRPEKTREHERRQEKTREGKKKQEKARKNKTR